MTDSGGDRYRADFGRRAGDYTRHRAGFPEETFLRLARLGVGVEGQALLDLGAGTGTLARGFARRGCRVTACDISAAMLAEGRRLAAEERLDIVFVEAPAESTGLPDRSFDAIVAGQCWHWFDGPKALAQAVRLLRPGGRLAIAHFDWLPVAGNVVEATEALILRHSPDWPMGGGTGFYPAWAVQMTAAGYREIETFSFDADQPYSHVDWRGRIRASAGVGGSLSPEAVEAFDRELAAVLRERYPAEPLRVPHRCWAVVARPPG